MLLFLVVLFIALAAFDAFHTIFMLKLHGIEIEMNGAIRKLCTWFGTTKGTILGIFIPTCAVAGVCWLFHWTILLLVLVIARISLAVLQIRYRITHAN
jgi:hypothetical protein